jgi:hypothetical protein
MAESEKSYKTLVMGSPVFGYIFGYASVTVARWPMDLHHHIQ